MGCRLTCKAVQLELPLQPYALSTMLGSGTVVVSDVEVFGFVQSTRYLRTQQKALTIDS